MKTLLILLLGSLPWAALALPPAFVPNVGQLRDHTGAALPHIDYMLQLPEVQIFLGKGQIHYVLRQSRATDVVCWRVTLQLPEVSAAAWWDAPVAEAVPYHLGMVWSGGVQHGVAAYTRLTLRNVQPGTDMVFAIGPDGQFKYDIHTHSGALAHLRWTVQGATPETAGTLLHLPTPLGTLTEELPAAWWQDGQPAQLRWHAQGASLGYILDQASPPAAKQLVIDPLLRRWATYMGGSGDDALKALAFFPNGDYAWGGSTASANFPAQAGVLTTYQGGLSDAILGRSNAAGTVQWATYYGGSLSEEITAVTVDSLGRIWAAGRTSSPEFVVFDGFDMTFGGLEDGFLLQFLGNGTFRRGTFLGGNSLDAVHSLQATPDGYLLAGGTTGSADFPVMGAPAVAYGGETDAWIGKFDTTGHPLWIRWLGGSGYDQGLALAVDSTAARYYLAGTTQSTDLPQTAGRAQPDNAGMQDAYLACLDSAGILLWATYWGGSDECHGTALALDSLGRPHLAGYTFSPDFPVRNPWQPARAGTGSEGFVAQFDTLGQCRWSTYLGGTDFDFIYGMALNPRQGTVYVTGRTASTDFPVADAGFLGSYRGGDWDAFVAELDSLGALTTALYYGGTGDDEGLAMASTATRTLLGGRTGSSTGFPVLNAWQFFYAGGSADAFVVAWDYSSTPTLRSPVRTSTGRLRVWPQPAAEQVQLALPQGQVAVSCEVYDALGRCVQTHTATSSVLVLPVDRLSPGLYTARVHTQQGTVLGARIVVGR
ncbi:MAG: T9SS type A sorting domain-containing protein [Bacteroidetes bacterium]|nr:T9SS type A sorting domain-containing protein [Bacteroidota bacterium]